MQEGSESLTALRLEVDSYKRLRVANVSLPPTGVVFVRGKNQQGKSSALDALAEVLGLSKAQTPITHGQHAGEIRVPLGEGPDALVARMKLTRGSDGSAKRALTIENAEGGKISSPASTMKALRGFMADPQAFDELKPAEQAAVALGVLGLEKELKERQERVDGFYDARRDVGRDLDRLAKASEALAEELRTLPMAPDGDPKELLAKLTSAKDYNSALALAVEKCEGAAQRGRTAAAAIAAHEEKIALLRQEHQLAAAGWNEAQDQIQGRSEIDTAPLVAALEAHERAAETRARREVHGQTVAELGVVEERHQELEANLTAARAAVADLLGTTKFPVEGMAYDPEAKQLTINGIPFSQASQAEKIRAAAGIAMAGNPKIKVLLMREGSLLDGDSLRIVHEMALERGFQVLVEQVADAPEGGSGIWIEDGEAFQESDLSTG